MRLPAKKASKKAKPAGKSVSVQRRGRPRAGEREERQRRVLDVALEELIEHGYDKSTMLGVASRAGASKETLYSWFGNKQGLFSALITQNADASAKRIEAALTSGGDARETLVGYSIGLLNLLTGTGSVALNRAAMSSPELSQILLKSGRFRVGPIVESYLERLASAGEINISSPADAFVLLYGLVVQDTQILVLLGNDVPSQAAIKERAVVAVDRFLQLCQ